MSKTNEESFKPVFKVDRVYAKDQKSVTSYVIALRVGGWTEEAYVSVTETLFSSDTDLKKLRAEMQDAKRKLLAKYHLFADEFPEVEAFGKAHIEAAIRRDLELPALPEPTGPLVGEVVN